MTAGRLESLRPTRIPSAGTLRFLEILGMLRLCDFGTRRKKTRRRTRVSGSARLREGLERLVVL
jgi:hypothetical protein